MIKDQDRGNIKTNHNPAPGGEREELGIVIIKQIILVSRVSGSVLGLCEIRWKLSLVGIERLL